MSLLGTPQSVPLRHSVDSAAASPQVALEQQDSGTAENLVFELLKAQCLLPGIEFYLDGSNRGDCRSAPHRLSLFDFPASSPATSCSPLTVAPHAGNKQDGPALLNFPFSPAEDAANVLPSWPSNRLEHNSANLLTTFSQPFKRSAAPFLDQGEDAMCTSSDCSFGGCSALDRKSSSASGFTELVSLHQQQSALPSVGSDKFVSFVDTREVVEDHNGGFTFSTESKATTSTTQSSRDQSVDGGGNAGCCLQNELLQNDQNNDSNNEANVVTCRDSNRQPMIVTHSTHQSTRSVQHQHHFAAAYYPEPPAYSSNAVDHPSFSAGAAVPYGRAGPAFATTPAYPQHLLPGKLQPNYNVVRVSDFASTGEAAYYCATNTSPPPASNRGNHQSGTDVVDEPRSPALRAARAPRMVVAVANNPCQIGMVQKI